MDKKVGVISETSDCVDGPAAAEIALCVDQSVSQLTVQNKQLPLSRIRHRRACNLRQIEMRAPDTLPLEVVEAGPDDLELELSGPAKTSSSEFAELAGSAPASG